MKCSDKGDSPLAHGVQGRFLQLLVFLAVLFEPMRVCVVLSEFIDYLELAVRGEQGLAAAINFAGQGLSLTHEFGGLGPQRHGILLHLEQAANVDDARPGSRAELALQLNLLFLQPGQLFAKQRIGPVGFRQLHPALVARRFANAQERGQAEVEPGHS